LKNLSQSIIDHHSSQSRRINELKERILPVLWEDYSLQVLLDNFANDGTEK